MPDSNGLILVPAFTGLGAPHWDPYARGIAVGITRGTKRAHFCRTALDSIALLQVEVQRPQCIETTALGAAYLAGLAVGVWKDRSEIARSWHMEQDFQPAMEAGKADDLKCQWNRAVERSQAWEEAE